VTDANKRLADAAAAAAAATPKPKQLDGIVEKYNLIIEELTRQAKISAASSKEYEIQNQLLGINKQFNYELTGQQQKQIRNLLTQIELQKNLAKVNEDISNIYRDITASSVADIGDRRISVELENRRRQYGEAAFNAKEKELRAAVEANLQAEASRNFMDQSRKFAYEQAAIFAQNTVELEVARKIEEQRVQFGQKIANSYADQIRDMVKLSVLATEEMKVEREMANLSADFTLIQTNINNLTSSQLDALIEINQIERSTGIELSNNLRTQIESNAETKKMIQNYRDINKSIQGINRAETGSAAGAVAAGQLGGLDPVTAAKTANETLFNGLQFLRDEDLISEQQYQTARLNAALQTSQAIFEAEKKMFESKSLLRIQEQTGTQFGLETQKQMAGEAAAFEMKSTQEKTQFALEQSASIMNSLGASNKKAFEAAKAFNIANAIMNTYMGATKALATYPPPINFIAAAAVVAMGLAQVSAIRSQQYSGRALGGPVMGGQPYLVGESGPELFTPNTTGSITRNNQLGSGGDTNVTFMITANDTTGFDELISSRKNLITQIIRDAQLERGVRGAM
jgi:hypothetical protein